MKVGFILKKRSSFSQMVRPPNTITSTSVTSCIFESLPVSRQIRKVVSASRGMKQAVTKMNPEYSLPAIVNTRSRIRI